MGEPTNGRRDAEFAALFSQLDAPCAAAPLADGLVRLVAEITMLKHGSVPRG
ncbi:MAG: hypothetical protein JO290_14365 [Sphingomonadaceae bacterium]|nr:hypothetical protein [Sphingomonadaceae bacterium]